MVAKKDKQARRLARKRKAQRRIPVSGQQILLNRVRASQHLPNTQVLVNPVGTEKMSEVILRFAEPFKDHDGLIPRAMLEDWASITAPATCGHSASPDNVLVGIS